jgi:hypothetical protein
VASHNHLTTFSKYSGGRKQTESIGLPQLKLTGQVPRKEQKLHTDQNKLQPQEQISRQGNAGKKKEMDRSAYKHQVPRFTDGQIAPVRGGCRVQFNYVKSPRKSIYNRLSPVIDVNKDHVCVPVPSAASSFGFGSKPY